MNEQNYDNQEITRYLLGALSSDETELFDELSVTDELFAVALVDAENDLLDRYARGELSEDELAKFKSYYSASPRRREKARFAETFQIYAKRDAAKKVADAISAKAESNEPRGGFFSFLQSSKNQTAPLRFGLGFAALLLMLAGGFLFLKDTAKIETAKQSAPSNTETKQPNQTDEILSSNTHKEMAAVNSATESAARVSASAPPKKTPSTQPAHAPEPEKQIAPPKNIVAAFVLSPSMRGDGEIKSLSIAKETTEINVNLELEADDFPVYLVALTDETGSVNIWRSGKIKAAGKGENKFLNIHFPARLLKSKIYSLAVSGVKSGVPEIIGNYPFRSVLR